MSNEDSPGFGTAVALELTPRGWATRARLVQAAAKVFAEIGFIHCHITGITTIAETAPDACPENARPLNLASEVIRRRMWRGSGRGRRCFPGARCGPSRQRANRRSGIPCGDVLDRVPIEDLIQIPTYVADMGCHHSIVQ